MTTIYENSIAENNYDVFEEMRELLDEDFNGLILEYIESAYECVEQLTDAFTDNNNKEGYGVAHKLKGASASLGLTQLSFLCGRMQDACRRNEIYQAGDLLTLLHQEVVATNLDIENRLN